MSFPPSVFMIGAQRCGTTMMASLLDQHSSITLSSPKEPAFFTIRQDRGLSWYRKCFCDDDRQLLVDATTWYSVAPTDLFPKTAQEKAQGCPYHGVPQRIHDVSPDARFVYMLRDPVSRIHSAYCYYSLAESHGQSFRQAITQNIFFLRGSDYIGQLENYLGFFPLDRFHFILFEDFIRDPIAVLNGLLRFLGLQEEAVDLMRETTSKNDPFLYNGLGRGLIRLLGSRIHVDKLRRGLKKLGSRNWAKVVDSILRKEPSPMSPEDQDFILSVFRPRNQLLAERTNLDLSSWRS